MKKLVILSILVIFTSVGCDTIKVKYGNKGDNNTSKPKNEQIKTTSDTPKPITNIDDINNIMNDNNSNDLDNNSNNSDNNTANKIQNNSQSLLDNGLGTTTLNSYINRYNILETNMEKNFMLFNNKITDLENIIKLYQNETDNLSMKISKLNNHINNLTIENNAFIKLIDKFKNYIVIFFVVILAIIVSLIFVIGSVYLRLGKIKNIIRKEPVKNTEPTVPTEEKKKTSTRKNMTVIDTSDDENKDKK